MVFNSLCGVPVLFLAGSFGRGQRDQEQTVAHGQPARARPVSFGVSSTNCPYSDNTAATTEVLANPACASAT